MATFHVIVKGFDSGLNEVLGAQVRRYDSRTKRMIVANPEKAKNDKICIKAIWRDIHNVRLSTPITIHYKAFVKDKKHDRMNIISAFDKSFQDALQTCKALKNDGYDDVVQVTWEMAIDKANPRVEVTITEVMKEG